MLENCNGVLSECIFIRWKYQRILSECIRMLFKHISLLLKNICIVSMNICIPFYIGILHKILIPFYIGMLFYIRILFYLCILFKIHIIFYIRILCFFIFAHFLSFVYCIFSSSHTFFIDIFILYWYDLFFHFQILFVICILF